MGSSALPGKVVSYVEDNGWYQSRPGWWPLLLPLKFTGLWIPVPLMPLVGLLITQGD